MRHFNRCVTIFMIAVACCLMVEPAWTQAPAQNNATPKPALKGFDPVALVNGQEIAGDKGILLERKGYRYLFANEENRKKFEKEPARFEIQLDGNCGAMPAVKGDPDLFAVVKGNIYVFASTACRTAFTADPERHVKARKNVAIFVHEGVELLDFAGPAEIFAAADRGRSFNVYTVAAAEGDITSQGFLTIKPRYSLTNCPKPDIIVLPGGNTRIPLGDERVLEWIRKATPEAEVVMSVCTGAFLLAKVGLLDGQEATTHWASITSLQNAAPKTKVRSDLRIVDNGKIVTTAGVSAGIDGALHVVDRLLGRQIAQDTARYAEYRWEPKAAK